MREEVLKTMDPNDIESINILKDRSAEEKYGAKGRNGVIDDQYQKEQKSADPIGIASWSNPYLIPCLPGRLPCA